MQDVLKDGLYFAMAAFIIVAALIRIPHGVRNGDFFQVLFSLGMLCFGLAPLANLMLGALVTIGLLVAAVLLILVSIFIEMRSPRSRRRRTS